MGKIAADPNGAAVTAPSFLGTQSSDPHSLPDASGSIECPGRNGARCSRTPIEPTPAAKKLTCLGLDGTKQKRHSYLYHTSQ
jgi:hypothetical protein